MRWVIPLRFFVNVAAIVVALRSSVREIASQLGSFTGAEWSISISPIIEETYRPNLSRVSGRASPLQ
jgi:hypothetical protein